MTHPQIIVGNVPLLFVADHASNAVPGDIDLGIDAALLDEHVSVDIGTEALTRALVAELDASAVMAGVSRLVIDLNREPEAAGLIPASSDGHAVPGNMHLTDEDRETRVARFHQPYHDAIAARIDAMAPKLIVAMHSFTPQLATRPREARPWTVGILYNGDDRAAQPAIAALRAQGLLVGDNEPYSGRVLNYTMNRHAEARGLPYINIEVRQDRLETPDDIDYWRNILAEAVRQTLSLLPNA